MENVTVQMCESLLADIASRQGMITELQDAFPDDLHCQKCMNEAWAELQTKYDQTVYLMNSIKT